jgi:hypothetical protein
VELALEENHIMDMDTVKEVKRRSTCNMYRGKMLTKFWLESLNEREFSEDLQKGGMIILKCTLDKLDGGCGLDSSSSGC